MEVLLIISGVLTLIMMLAYSWKYNRRDVSVENLRRDRDE